MMPDSVHHATINHDTIVPATTTNDDILPYPEPICYACGLSKLGKTRHTLVSCTSPNCATYNPNLLPNSAHLPACGGQPGWKPGQSWYCSARCYLDELDSGSTTSPRQADIPTSHIYLATLNCHGLLVNRYAVWKALHTQKYDILMLNVTERRDSKLKKYIPEPLDADFYLHFPQYDLIWGDAQRKGHGVAVYVREGAVKGTRVESVRLPHKGLFGIDPKETDVAANFLGLRTIDAAPWNGATLISAFRPPRDEMRFQRAFVDRLSFFLEANASRAVVAGDMNFDCPLFRLRTSAQQIVRGPTRQLAGAKDYQNEQLQNSVQKPIVTPKTGHKWKIGTLKRNATYTSADATKTTRDSSSMSVRNLMELIRRPYKKSAWLQRTKRTQSTHDINTIKDTDLGDTASRQLQIEVVTSDNEHEMSTSPPLSPHDQQPINGNGTAKHVNPDHDSSFTSKQWTGNQEGACLDLILVTDKVNWVKCGLGMALEDKHSKTRSRLVWAQLQITPPN